MGKTHWVVPLGGEHAVVEIDDEGRVTLVIAERPGGPLLAMAPMDASYVGSALQEAAGVSGHAAGKVRK